MKRKGLTYYAGLLTAAQYYGAAHQRPQEFQVFTQKNRRPIRCGKVRAKFIARKNIDHVRVQEFNTSRGWIHFREGFLSTLSSGDTIRKAPLWAFGILVAITSGSSTGNIRERELCGKVDSSNVYMSICLY